jgi:hypothetical protein
MGFRIPSLGYVARSNGVMLASVARGSVRGGVGVGRVTPLSFPVSCSSLKQPFTCAQPRDPAEERGSHPRLSVSQILI